MAAERAGGIRRLRRDLKATAGWWAFRTARGRFAGAAVRWVFAHAARALPVRRVEETARVIAFHHPRPGWPVHVLLVPRRGIRALTALTDTDGPYLAAMFDAASRLARTPHVGDDPVAVVINGGTSQDIAQLHAHLIAGPAVPRYARPPLAIPIDAVWSGRIVTFPHPVPARMTHFVVRLAPDDPGETGFLGMEADLVRDLVLTIRHLVGTAAPPLPGWSLVASTADGTLHLSCLHVVSGDRIDRGRAAPVQSS
ncbi:MAG: HIT domain-containing protein [Thermomicrobiales bacterium]